MQTRDNILAALAYYDVFAYPLKKREIWLFLQEPCDQHEFDMELDKLVNEMTVYRLGEFYSLVNNYAIVQGRITGNEHAKKLMIKANKVAAFLARFPYARGIAVSGSLSKNFASKTADIDLFIITAPNRLWICRTIMHLYKKLTYLTGSQHYYCMNYFVDQLGMDIPEKNIYTATEITTLIPLRGSGPFKSFFQANSWTKSFLPNNYLRISIAKDNGMGISRLIETLFNNRMGTSLDNWLMRVTNNRWLRKTRKRKLNIKGVVMTMVAEKHVSKPDPEYFQPEFIKNYQLKTTELCKKYADADFTFRCDNIP